MAASKDLITKIILKGQQDPSLAKAFQNVDKMTEGSISKLKNFGSKTATFMKKAATVVGTATAAAATASVKAAIDYESAFAGVMKTVNETGTTTYDDLSEGIINMSKRMPATASEIAAVAESAGQLGIKADDILKFSETMVNLGETTNLSSEEAASSIAKMFNITGTNMKDVDKFGATLVALGNNAATTEADILNMASRIAAGGSQIGLTEQQILALSTTLSSVGLEAEGGGTAISTVLANIDKDVATNSDNLGEWAKIAGMSTSEFTKLWGSDTFGAVQKVIGGLGDASKGGKNMNVMLEDLGISGIRTTDTMKRLTNASGLLGDMTNLANKAWSEGNALQNEANVRYGTMASKLSMAKNNVTALAIKIGEKLMPYVDKAVEKFNNIDFDAVAEKAGVVIDQIANVFKWISDHSTTIMTIIAAVAGAIAGFKIASTIAAVVKLVSVIVSISKAIGVVKLLGLAMSALGGPVVLAVAVIAGLVAAFVVLWNKCDGFRNFWIGLWEKIKSACSAAGAWLKNFFTVTIPNAWNTFLEFMKSLPSRVASFLSSLPYKIGYLLGFCIVKIIQFRNNAIAKAKELGMRFLTAVVNFFMQLPSRVWTWLSNTVQKVVTWGSDMVAKGKAAATQLKDGIINVVKQLPSKMLELGKNIAMNVWNGIKNAKSFVINKVKEFGSGVIDGIKSAVGLGSKSNTASKSTKIPKHGNGGTFTNPHMAVVGDAPETIVPHGNTPRNRSLLREAAAGVGASLGGVNHFNFTFAPVISGGNVEENRRMLQEEEAEFERRMDEYFAKKGRLAF